MVEAEVKVTKHHNAVKGTIKGIERGLLESAIFLEGQAVKNAPRDSGFLRASITRVVKGLTASVGSNLVYAKIQEEGGTIRGRAGGNLRFKTKSGQWVTTKSVTIPATRYLSRAADSLRARISIIFGKDIRAEIRRS